MKNLYLILMVVALVRGACVAEDEFPTYFYEADTSMKRSELARRAIEAGEADMLISVFNFTPTATVKEVFSSDDLKLKRRFLIYILPMEHGGWGRGSMLRPPSAWIHVAGWVIPFLNEEFPETEFQAEDLKTHQSRLELLDKVQELGGDDYLVDSPKVHSQAAMNPQPPPISPPTPEKIPEPTSTSWNGESASLNANENKPSETFKWPYIVVGIALLGILAVVLRARRRNP